MSELGLGMGVADHTDEGFPVFAGITSANNGHRTLEMPDMGEAQLAAAEEMVDSVWLETVDAEEEDKIDVAMRPPGGFYMVQHFNGGTLTTREVEMIVKEGEELRTVKRVRPFVNFYGVADPREYKGTIWTPRINFRFSPVPAYRKTREGEPDPSKFDLVHRLWRDAQAAYAVISGKKQFQRQEVIQYLLEYPVKVQVMSPKDGLLVLGLTEVRG